MGGGGGRGDQGYACYFRGVPTFEEAVTFGRLPRVVVYIALVVNLYYIYLVVGYYITG